MKIRDAFFDIVAAIRRRGGCPHSFALSEVVPLPRHLNADAVSAWNEQAKAAIERRARLNG